MGDDVVLVCRVRCVHLSSLCLQLWIVQVEICCTEWCKGDAPGVMGNRLCGIDHLTWNVGFGWDESFDHWVDRFPGLSVPEVEQAVFSSGADSDAARLHP